MIRAVVAQRSAAISKFRAKLGSTISWRPFRRLTVLPHFPAPLDKLLEPGARPASTRSRSSARPSQQLCLRQMPTSRFWRIDAVVSLNRKICREGVTQG